VEKNALEWRCFTLATISFTFFYLSVVALVCSVLVKSRCAKPCKLVILAVTVCFQYKQGPNLWSKKNNI